MLLDIYVQGHHVGVLEQAGLSDYVFTYLPDTPPTLAVSLLMPVRTRSWVHSMLHPVFQISLPEGALRQSLENHFAKKFNHFGDMELLAVVGENLVGQVQAVPHGQPLAGLTPHESLTRLLQAPTDDLVRYYMGDRLSESGVSGGFPKFLANSPVATEGDRLTLIVDRWVVKLNDDDHPHLAQLEYFCMCVAREMGLRTPEFLLSQDTQHLLVRRFDVAENGSRLGFEDMCALAGLPARDKFSGSVERIAKIIQQHCTSGQARASLDEFYAQYLLASVIRNGDAHLKNFGLLYAPGGQPRLAPVYDMVSMAVYAPRTNSGDADDTMALTLGGTKRFLTAKTLPQLARVCRVTEQRHNYWCAKLLAAMQKVRKDVEALDSGAAFTEQARRMLDLWGHGVAVSISCPDSAIPRRQW